MKAKPRRRAPNLLRNPAVASFIAAGRNYCELFAGPQPPPEQWCGAALWCLSQLYLAACALPETRWDEKLDRWENPFVLTDRDRTRVTHVAETMLGGARRYRVWLDPRREPEEGEEPEEGDLVQDLAEIYREIKPGLTAARRAGGCFPGGSGVEVPEFRAGHRRSECDAGAARACIAGRRAGWLQRQPSDVTSRVSASARPSEVVVSFELLEVENLEIEVPDLAHSSIMACIAARFFCR